MWLLIGGDSEIGAATNRALAVQKLPVAATTRRRERAGVERPFLDLAAPPDDWQPPPSTRAACIFAAIARLAACEADPAGSAHVNVTQTLGLIDRLLARGIYVLFLSTNQVFDGDAPNILADATLSPVSEYGRQKARTEVALRQRLENGAAVAILRLAKVVSPDTMLIRNWICALKQGQRIRAFHDMRMAPTPIGLVCDAIVALLKSEARGIFQFTGPRDVTYADAGRYLAGRLKSDPRLVTETSAADSGMPKGATPRHTTLDSSALRQRFGLICPDVWPVIDTVQPGV
jgi:dTDP-4-dehydrorhamnose reductase